MKRVLLLVTGICVAVAVAVPAAVPAAQAQAQDAALGKVKVFLATARAEAEKIATRELASAKVLLPAAIEKGVVGPAIEYAINRAIPAGDEALRRVRADVDRRLAEFDGGMSARVLAFSEALETLAAKKDGALTKVLADREGRAKKLAAFDGNAVLDTLLSEAKRRATGLARGRVAALLDDVIAVLVAPLRTALEAADAGLDQVPGMRAIFAGYTGELAHANTRTLRKEGKQLANDGILARANTTLQKIFDAARGKGTADARFAPIVAALRGYAQEAGDRVLAAKTEAQATHARFTALQAVRRPPAVTPEIIARERAQLIQAVVADAKSDPAAKKRPEVVALIAADKQLTTAKATAEKSVRDATTAAVKACATQGAACISKRIEVAQKAADKQVATTTVATMNKAQASLRKVEVTTELAKSFSPPTAPNAPTLSAFNSAPLKLDAVATKAAKVAEQAAAKEIPSMASVPTTAAPAKTTEQVIADAGAAKTVSVTGGTKPTALLPPVVAAKPQSGAVGVRSMLAVLQGLAKQAWQRVLAGALAAAAKARGGLSSKARLSFDEALKLIQSGAQFMYVGAARARLVQLQRLFGAVTPSLIKAVNAALARAPTYLQGLLVRVGGASSATIDTTCRALIHLAIIGQRLVLASRLLVGKARWKDAKRAMTEFFGGLARAKRGLRLAAALLRPVAVAKKVASTK